MTAQSWVETTLPPGYVMVHSWGGRGYVWQEHGRQGWEATRADACRAAWRHWTAAVLRGRGVEWRVDDDGDMESECGRAAVLWHCALAGHRVGRVLTVEGGYHNVECAKCYDIDEAMARFAMLVLATEGPAMQRGDK